MTARSDHAKARQVQNLIRQGKVKEAQAGAETISNPALAQQAQSQVAQAEKGGGRPGCTYPRTSGGPVPPATLQQALEVARENFSGQVVE